MKASLLIHKEIYEIFDQNRTVKVRYRGYNINYDMFEFIDKNATIYLYKQIAFEALKVRYAKVS